MVNTLTLNDEGKLQHDWDVVEALDKEEKHHSLERPSTASFCVVYGLEDFKREDKGSVLLVSPKTSTTLRSIEYADAREITSQTRRTAVHRRFVNLQEHPRAEENAWIESFKTDLLNLTALKIADAHMVNSEYEESGDLLDENCALAIEKIKQVRNEMNTDPSFEQALKGAAALRSLIEARLEGVAYFPSGVKGREKTSLATDEVDIVLDQYDFFVSQALSDFYAGTESVESSYHARETNALVRELILVSNDTDADVSKFERLLAGSFDMITAFNISDRAESSQAAGHLSVDTARIALYPEYTRPIANAEMLVSMAEHIGKTKNLYVGMELLDRRSSRKSDFEGFWGGDKYKNVTYQFRGNEYKVQRLEVPTETTLREGVLDFAYQHEPNIGKSIRDDLAKRAGKIAIKADEVVRENVDLMQIFDGMRSVNNKGRTETDEGYITAEENARLFVFIVGCQFWKQQLGNYYESMPFSYGGKGKRVGQTPKDDLADESDLLLNALAVCRGANVPGLDKEQAALVASKLYLQALDHLAQADADYVSSLVLGRKDPEVPLSLPAIPKLGVRTKLTRDQNNLLWNRKADPALFGMSNRVQGHLSSAVINEILR